MDLLAEYHACAAVCVVPHDHIYADLASRTLRLVEGWLVC